MNKEMTPEFALQDSMILATSSERPKTIGQRYTGMWLDGVYHPDWPFVVLREASAEEWPGQNGPYPPEAEEALRTGRVLYYEIRLALDPLLR
jgi:hypothetical protein